MSHSFDGLTRNIDIFSVNERAHKIPLDLVGYSEVNYQNQIVKTAELIKKERFGGIVLLAGPSGSGKTTTAHKLCGRLNTIGISAHVISLDDFFLDSDKIPKDEYGSPDIENVTALDIDEIKRCFTELIRKGQAVFPEYDFKTASRLEKGQLISMEPDDILIVEGIHALNPILMSDSYERKTFKLYVGVASQFTKDGRLLMTSRNVRLMRRMVRDYNHRGAAASHTFALWPGVCRGEDLYIRPFRNEARVRINTLHLYEICVYHHKLIPILEEISTGDELFIKVLDLKNKLDEFYDLDAGLVPADSMLMEFLG